MQRARSLAIPAYLFLCLVLGGSSQGVLGNLALQLAGLALLVWSALTRAPSVPTTDASFIAWLSGAAVLLVSLQLVPLPPAVWTLLPGRAPVADAYRMLGQELPWLPWSLAPYQTLSTSLSLIPPLAILGGILRLGAYRTSALAMGIVLGSVASVLLGALQVTTRSGYLYQFTSIGQAAGFFANANYLGTLLLAAIPFVAALLARHAAQHAKVFRRRVGIYAVVGGAGALVLLGLALNQSTAALLLSAPVILASAALLLPPASRIRLPAAGVAVAAGAAAALAFASAPLSVGGDAAASVLTRQDIYTRSAAIAGDMFPVGTGLGAFPRTYPWYEDADAVDWVYVNHVHNDYLEIVLEAGLPGLLLLLAFMLWWVRRSYLIWRSPVSGRFVRAATIASAAILAHSAVDFPVRTAAIAAVLAACVALMTEPRPRRAAEPEGVRSRPARHLSLD